VTLEIYNIKGQLVKTLVNEVLPAGEHSIIWDGRDSSGNRVSSGIYLYKLNVNDKTKAVKKCLLLK
jgi:flagellar hook assembly protein FlgD